MTASEATFQNHNSDFQPMTIKLSHTILFRYYQNINAVKAGCRPSACVPSGHVGLAIRGSNPQDDNHGRSVGRSGKDNDGVFHTQY